MKALVFFMGTEVEVLDMQDTSNTSLVPSVDTLNRCATAVSAAITATLPTVVPVVTAAASMPLWVQLLALQITVTSTATSSAVLSLMFGAAPAVVMHVLPCTHILTSLKCLQCHSLA